MGDEDSRDRQIAAADAELDEVSARLEAELRRNRPDLFNQRGRLGASGLAELLEQRLGTSSLSTSEIRALLDKKRAANAARTS